MLKGASGKEEAADTEQPESDHALRYMHMSYVK